MFFLFSDLFRNFQPETKKACSMIRIEARDLQKQFNDRLIFSHINFTLQSGESLAITGPNGSGKTTLVRIVSGLLSPSGGAIVYHIDGRTYRPVEVYPLIGLVGPYLQLYLNLTAWENLVFFSKIRGLTVDKSRLRRLMAHFGLAGRELDLLKTFSSGMLQRMKYVVALIHQPEVLLVDEPTSNLDEEGSETVYQLLDEQQQNKILIVATNEPEEIRFGRKRVDVAGQE